MKTRAWREPELETGWVKEPEMQSVVDLAGCKAKQHTCPLPLCALLYIGIVCQGCWEWPLRSQMWLKDRGDKVDLDRSWLKEVPNPFSGHWNHFTFFNIQITREHKGKSTSPCGHGPRECSEHIQSSFSWHLYAHSCFTNFWLYFKWK